MAAALLGFACGPATTPTPVPTLAPNPTVNIKYATGFSIDYLPGGYKKITDAEGRQLLLVPRGKDIPEEYKNLQKIEIPVEKVVTFSSTEDALLRPLGVLSSIVGVTLPKSAIEELQKGLEEGRIKFLGRRTALDYEALLKLHPGLVFLWTRSGNMNEVLAKLEELQIPAAVDNEYLENHPLGRLEWVKFLAAFYDKEEAATKFFEDAERRVEEVEKRSTGARMPKVLWMLIVDNGTIYVPRGGSYAAKMIELTGGDYLFKDISGIGSQVITAEELFARGIEADIVIWSSLPEHTPSIKAILERQPVLEDLPVIKEGKVWQFLPRYQDSLDETAEIMEQLNAIFHPESFPGYQLNHFRRMPRE